MAKAKKKKTPSKAKKPARATAPATLTNEQKAASIVAHVLAHFGAGYAVQRQTEAGSAVPPVNQPIFDKPIDLATFHFMLLDSTIRNFGALNWDNNAPVRDQVTTAAFNHGALARQRVVADGTGTLSILQILSTLVTVQASCPGGAGGGAVCDF